jgi:arsenate reductase (glutaredoxin)
MSTPFPLTLHGITQCDTVKKARDWLVNHEIDYIFQDFKKEAPKPQQLDAWLAVIDWTLLINRKGTMWRRLNPTEQAKIVDNATAKALALQTPSVIKRPVATWPDGSITVGFNAAQWAEKLGQDKHPSIGSLPL